MKHYTKEVDHGNSAVTDNAKKNVNRMARRLNRELGISMHHALAAVEANGASKEKYDG